MPMSLVDQEKLCQRLKAHHLYPARTHHLAGGRTSYHWFVDNHDDRYVEVQDSSESQDFLIVVRDGSEVNAGVVGSTDVLLATVARELEVLSKSDLAKPKSDK
jgi:hypothetical protein